MKRNRTLAGALALILICSAFLFSGCSSKPSGSASSPKETSSEGKSTEKKVTLEYYSWGDEDAYMPEIVDAFNAQSASTQVNLTIVPTPRAAPNTKTRSWPFWPAEPTWTYSAPAR